MALAAAIAQSDDPLEFGDDLFGFVSQPAPEGVVVTCEITRNKKEKGKYVLRLEREIDGRKKKTFLLAAKKRKRTAMIKGQGSNYLISIDAHDMSRDSDSFVAKLRSNAVGTAFTVMDDGLNPGKASGDPAKQVRKELAAVMYETNVMGFKGPRKMTVVIPGMDDRQQPIAVMPKVDRDKIVERFKLQRMTDLLTLRNKQPTWNEETQSYVLNFGGRVKAASVKNFQIVHEEDPDYVILQFGRVGEHGDSDEHTFTMDYQYPMTALQAFGICLSSFDNKLACE